jgi:hypothetical protein
LCPSCVIGAIVGVGTGYALSALTGEDYSVGAAASDAAFGALGGGILGKLSRIRQLRSAARAVDGTSDVARGTARQRRTLAEHVEKLKKYREDPDAFDNRGILKDAPSQEVRESIIRGRIRHLENEIRAIRKAIDETARN